MATWFGINAPFVGGNENILSRQYDEKLIRNDLLQLLLTSPGERVMRPDFGSPIRRFLFEQITQNAIGQLQAGIRLAISTYEQRVVVSDVQIISQPERNLIQIRVFGSFNLNRFNTAISGNADLLVEFGVPTNKIRLGINV